MNHCHIRRVKAVIDWVEIDIETHRQTNFQTVQRVFASALNLPPGTNVYVAAIAPNEGGGTCYFSLRIHDVTTYSSIEQTLSFVSAKLPLCGNWLISKIELAVDAYCDDPADQAARFYKFMANPVSTNRRMYRDFKGSGKAIPRHFDSIKRHLAEGWQIGIGNKTDDQYQHIYVKDDDTINGKRQEVEKRARLEIRLSGTALATALQCQTPEQWRQCRFEKLTDYFRLRELKDDLDPLLQTLAEAADLIGKRKTRNRREGGTRQYSKATKADPTNETTRNALRKLADRWKGAGKRGRPAKSGTRSGCGFSGGINQQNPHECWDRTANSNNYIHKNNNKDSHEQQHHHDDGRNCDMSAESAEPIPTDPTRGVTDDLVQLYEATPEAKKEHERIDAIMEVCVGDAALHEAKS